MNKIKKKFNHGSLISYLVPVVITYCMSADWFCISQSEKSQTL